MLEHLGTYALAYVLGFTAFACAYFAWDDRQFNKYYAAKNNITK